jgi:hypothetical protein
VCEREAPYPLPNRRNDLHSAARRARRARRRARFRLPDHARSNSR